MEVLRGLLFKGALMSVLSPQLMAQSLECNSGMNARYYDQGRGMQRNVVYYLWEQNFQKDCNRLDDFISAVELPFGLDQPTSPTLKCRNQGLSEGLHDALEGISNDCNTECLSNGQAIGELTGAQACASSISAAQKTVTVCDVNSRLACRTALYGYVQKHCPQRANLLEVLVSACEF